MGLDVKFQAIPEDCELVRRARADRELAERLEFLKLVFEENAPDDELDKYIAEVAKTLTEQHPGLFQRYLFAGGRRWDEIVYLLSDQRRAGNWETDNSLIHQAIYGSERLHLEAETVQGFPIGFVPVKDVKIIADCLDAITYEQFNENYNPQMMVELCVYKMSKDDNELSLQYTWKEFQDIRNLYRQAANHNEAVIVTMD